MKRCGCSLLVTAFYSFGKRYVIISGLKNVNISLWEEIVQNTLRGLMCCSMSDRVFALIKKNWFIHGLLSCIFGQYSNHYAAPQNNSVIFLSMFEALSVHIILKHCVYYFSIILITRKTSVMRLINIFKVMKSLFLDIRVNHKIE